MAQNLSTAIYTLKQFKANVLNKTGLLSRQEMKLIKPQFDSFVHDAILLIRTLMGTALDDFYTTKVALASVTLVGGFGTASIAAKSLADPGKIRLYDPTLGIIPVVPLESFLSHQDQYSTTEMTATGAVATLLATSAVADTAPYTLNIAFYTGAATPLATVEMYYPRNPIKVVTDADTVDLPDNLTPIAEDMVAIAVMRKLNKTPAAEIDARATGFIRMQMEKLGLKSPVGN